MSNPEQPVLDAIAELVDWQLEEGRRRGDGPGLSDRTPTDAALAWINACYPAADAFPVRPRDRWTFDRLREERLRHLASVGLLHDPALILPARADSRSAPGIEGEPET